MSRDIAAVLITVDRSPQRNYLSETLSNLERGGLNTSRRLHSLTLVDSGPGSMWAESQARGTIRTSGSRVGHRCANHNVAAALELGAATGCRWVLFLEDDIDVCAEFFDSVGAWIDGICADEQEWSPVYALGANYPQIDDIAANGGTVWRYPVDQFYGTQALVFDSNDVRSVADYLRAHCYDRAHDGTAYDLIIADWARQRGISHFVASCPSFIQHVGRTSSIRPRPHTHTFPSWPGREWSYLDRQTQDRRSTA